MEQDRTMFRSSLMGLGQKIAPVTPGVVLSSIVSGGYWGSVGYFTDPDGAVAQVLGTNTTPPFTIQINTWSPLPMPGVTFNSWNVATIDENAVTLLHALGNTLRRLGWKGGSFNTNDNYIPESNRSDDLLRSNCGFPPL